MFFYSKQLLMIQLAMLLFGAAEALKCWECQENYDSIELHQCDTNHTGISKECGTDATCQVDELRQDGKILVVSKHCYTRAGGNIGYGEERCKSWTEAHGITRHFCSCDTDNCNEFGIDGIAAKAGEESKSGGEAEAVRKPKLVAMGLLFIWNLVCF